MPDGFLVGGIAPQWAGETKKRRTKVAGGAGRAAATAAKALSSYGGAKSGDYLWICGCTVLCVFDGQRYGERQQSTVGLAKQICNAVTSGHYQTRRVGGTKSMVAVW